MRRCYFKVEPAPRKTALRTIVMASANLLILFFYRDFHRVRVLTTTAPNSTTNCVKITSRWLNTAYHVKSFFHDRRYTFIKLKVSEILAPLVEVPVDPGWNIFLVVVNMIYQVRLRLPLNEQFYGPKPQISRINSRHLRRISQFYWEPRRTQTLGLTHNVAPEGATEFRSKGL